MTATRPAPTAWRPATKAMTKAAKQKSRVMEEPFLGRERRGTNAGRAGHGVPASWLSPDEENIVGERPRQPPRQPPGPVAGRAGQPAAMAVGDRYLGQPALRRYPPQVDLQQRSQVRRVMRRLEGVE